MFSAYIRLEQLPDDVKSRNKIKLGASIPRFDVTATAGYYKPLEKLKNLKGQIYLYLTETRGIINSPDQRRADRFLMAKNSINFSSVYLLEQPTDGSGFFVGFGNPNDKKTCGKGKKIENPFYDNRNDGFLFVISHDWKSIEVLVIPDGKFTIMGNAKQFADGCLNEAINTLRKEAKTFFQY